MFGQRGQGAMEYLMTYGWAILVVMIVGIVMWQLGIFNLGSTSVTASGFAKIKPQLAACKMTTTGTFSCLFTNGAGATAIVNSAVVKVGTVTVTSTAVSTVNVGDNLALSVTGLQTGTAGQPYSADVTLSYTLNVAGVSVTHTDNGKVKGPYEA